MEDVFAVVSRSDLIMIDAAYDHCIFRVCAGLASSQLARPESVCASLECMHTQFPLSRLEDQEVSFHLVDKRTLVIATGYSEGLLIFYKLRDPASTPNHLSPSETEILLLTVLRHPCHPRRSTAQQMLAQTLCLATCPL
jgi:hypothetical protein